MTYSDSRTRGATAMGGTGRRRVARRRTYLMCPPTYFAVEYSINPWMNPDVPVNAALAGHQWWQLRETFVRLGHTVHLVDPRPGLPDMVFAANGATAIGRKVLGARFRHPQRAAEAAAYADWLDRSGYGIAATPGCVNEGEGDIIFAGRAIIAGHGFRTDEAVKDEIERLFGLPVLSVRLVDPRYYHLDTALCVLDADTAAYYPAAFDDDGRAALAGHFAELIEAKDEDAEVLGLNAVSDGRHVVLPEQATGLATQLADRGFEPVGVDMSEFLSAGGGPKCCTLELH
jgi:N-dimethylarginine dimethylaminohydrolase